jgi:hypothetical protein
VPFHTPDPVPQRPPTPTNHKVRVTTPPRGRRQSSTGFASRVALSRANRSASAG